MRTMLNVTEAAEYLGYSVSRFRRLVQEGGIRYFQAGKGAAIKFRAEWLDAFVDAHTRPIEQVRELKRQAPKPNPDIWAA